MKQNYWTNQSELESTLSEMIGAEFNHRPKAQNCLFQPSVERILVADANVIVFLAQGSWKIYGHFNGVEKIYINQDNGVVLHYAPTFVAMDATEMRWYELREKE